MDRRGFLKAAGLGAGAAVMCRVPEAEGKANVGPVGNEVYDRVISPKDIFEDPTVGPVFDLNDDVSGLAAHFTAKLLVDYAEKYGLHDTQALAMIQWGLRQPAMLGLLLAKCVVTLVFKDGEQARRIMNDPVFKEMYTVYGEILAGKEENLTPNALGQYVRLRV